jgi:hypothetical protein
MADYAGAEAAIRARLEENWSTTRITFENETPADPWPPLDGEGLLVPWVNLEIECYGSEIVGQGRPGNHVYRYNGSISVHVFTPVGTADTLGKEYAVAIGEVFRRKTFYQVAPGVCVRTEDPYPSDSDKGSNDGNWFATTTICPFVYWHRG